MKRITSIIIGTAVVAGFTLAIAGTAAAQRRSAPQRPAHATTARPTSAPQTSKDVSTFRGISTKLGTTPENLESAYQTAKQANPKLTRGQFVAANMLAHNLSSKNSAITTDAILSGLQSGKSIGQTLQSLGLSEQDSKAAEQQAKRDIRQAQQEGAKPQTP